ncbi:MAG: hypothetical protein H6704_20315 [Myxococcales bacterium]|nr:hypothetical protein [Myxococcales bacterium]
MRSEARIELGGVLAVAVTLLAGCVGSGEAASPDEVVELQRRVAALEQRLEVMGAVCGSTGHTGAPVGLGVPGVCRATVIDRVNFDDETPAQVWSLHRDEAGRLERLEVVDRITYDAADAAMKRTFHYDANGVLTQVDQIDRVNFEEQRPATTVMLEYGCEGE